MVNRSRILVIAATAHELAPPAGWQAGLCGVGPVEAAAGSAALIADYRPQAVLHVGIAGARRARALPPAALVIGSSACYCDLGVSADWAPSEVDAPAELIAAAQRALPDAYAMRIATSARIGGGAGFDVEAMEGFGVMRAAQRAGVPAIEVRAISNEVEETNRDRWHFAMACAAIVAATPLLVDEIAQCVS